MPHDHPGFAYWEADDPGHPFPVGNIDLRWGDADTAKAVADLAPPRTQPTPATVAERSIGVARSAQFWFALECATDVLGKVTCEAVLRGRHVHYWPEHGEDQPGPIQEVRLSMADLGLGFGTRERLAPHGPLHCDLFTVTWFLWEGKVRCELFVSHFAQTVQQFLDMREKNRREAEREPPRRIELPPLPEPEEDGEGPKPEPHPGPDGAMAPGGPFGMLTAFFQRIWRAVFG